MATPIGNLRDLSRRACDVLCDVRLVAAEDTRHTRQLLQEIGSNAELVSAHTHNERSRVDQISAILAAGDSCALVSDAGTPAISDPGARLVNLIREAGFRVIPIPGPSAVITLLSAAGIDADRFGEAADRFQFEGFLPARAGARKKRLEALSRVPVTLVLMEAPHRIAACLTDLATVYGPDRTLVIGRELTKRFEQIVSIKTGQANAWLDSDSNHSRGEFILALAPPETGSADHDDADHERIERGTAIEISSSAGQLMTLLLAELPPAKAVRLARKLTNLPADPLYALAVEIQSESRQRGR